MNWWEYEQDLIEEILAILGSPVSILDKILRATRG